MTSSSSGHSGDERWYEEGFQDLEVAPPLPTKMATRSNHSNNTYPSTPKRNNVHQISQMQVSTPHNHYGTQNIQHSKIQVSHSLPLQHVNYSTPLTATLHNNTSDYDLSYSDKNNLLKQQNDRLRQENDYMVTRAPKVNEYSTLQQINNDFNRNDGHSTDSSISERLYGIGSEDELSNGSGGNISPRSRRAAKHLGSLSSNNSRNQSPRSVNGEAKLRPGVTPRSSNRNSANLSSNAFQEELIRLINPDNIEASSEPKLNKEQRNHCRENLNNSISVHKTQPEVILTMARPATVISNASTTSSPLPSEFKNGKDEDGSSRGNVPNKSKSMMVPPEDLPLPKDMDWPSLVDTATRVMLQVAGSSEENEPNDSERNRHWEDEDTADVSISSA